MEDTMIIPIVIFSLKEKGEKYKHFVTNSSAESLEGNSVTSSN